MFQWTADRRAGRAGEAGNTFIEVAVVTAIIALLVSLMMPSLQGYTANAEVRSAAAEAVYQLRQAQFMALADDVQYNLLFDPSADLPSRGYVQGWEVCTTSASCSFTSTWSTSDPATYRTTVPISVHMTAYCYRGGFTPTGQYLNWAGVCASPGATDAVMCFDGGATSSPYEITVTVTMATGEITEKAGVGVCNA